MNDALAILPMDIILVISVVTLGFGHGGCICSV